MRENWAGAEDGHGDELPLGEARGPALLRTPYIYDMALPPLSHKFWWLLSPGASQRSPGWDLLLGELCNREIRHWPQLTVMYLPALRRRNAFPARLSQQSLASGSIAFYLKPCLLLWHSSSGQHLLHQCVFELSKKPSARWVSGLCPWGLQAKERGDHTACCCWVLVPLTSFLSSLVLH